MGTRVSRGVAVGRPWSGWRGARTVAPGSSTDSGHRFGGLEQAFSSDRYTVCRAVAHAFRDRFPGAAGLVCESMRETRVGSGENLVLFGDDGEELTMLEPLTEWEVTAVSGKGGKPTIRAKQVSEAPHPSPATKGFTGS